jgi:EpsI family protein
MIRRREVPPLVVLAAGVLLTAGVRPQHVMPLARPLATLPSEIAGLRATEMTIADDEREVAGMSEYALRRFGRDSATLFTTYVGYYDFQTQGKTIHSPKNCLPGSGWQALGMGTVTLDVDGVRHPVNRYLLANGRRQALVYYWYQGRGRVVANEYLVKWNLLRDATLLGRTEEALARVVVFIPDGVRLGETGPDSTAGATPDDTARDAAIALIRSLEEILPAAPRGL